MCSHDRTYSLSRHPVTALIHLLFSYILSCFPYDKIAVLDYTAPNSRINGEWSTGKLWEEAVMTQLSSCRLICLWSPRKITKNLNINGVATKIPTGYLLYTRLMFYHNINLPSVSLYPTNLMKCIITKPLNYFLHVIYTSLSSWTFWLQTLLIYIYWNTVAFLNIYALFTVRCKH